MVARLALSSNAQTGQYVGTSRINSPTDIPGSRTARSFNGLGNRLVLGRSSDLGANFLALLTFWRATSAAVADNQTSARLFTQYTAIGTRIAVGINRSFLSITYTTSGGSLVTVESRVSMLNTNRQILALLVSPTAVTLYLNGRLALQVNVVLMAPGTPRMVVGADVNSRAFAGTIDDLALYQVVPGRLDNWLRYHQSLIDGEFVRDYVAATFAAGFDGVTLLDDLRQANGTGETARVATSQPWRNEGALGRQLVEFRYTTGVEPIRVGVFSTGHNLATANIGDTEGSYAYLQDGTLISNGVVVASDLPLWTQTDMVALSYVPGSRQLSFWVNGALRHAIDLPVGTWTPATSFGKRQVFLNAGQSVPYATGLPTRTGLYTKVWSRLTSEFRHMKLGQVAAPLDDIDEWMRDANTEAIVGAYIGARLTETPFTPDPFDIARKVGGGVRLNFGPYTAAGQDYFFALAFSPTAEDLVDEKILFECPDQYGMKLIDGRLFAWVGDVQVGSINVAFEENKAYLMGITRSAAGRLLVWCHVGYILQSGDITPLLGSADVWVGSKADGSAAFTGRFSHLVASTKRPADWKLNRLKTVYAWDTPDIEGLIPAPVAVKRVFEPSWRDVIATAINPTPTATQCFVAAIAAQPDEVAIEYRMVARKGVAAFLGENIGNFTPHGYLSTEVGKFGDALLTLNDPVGLALVAVGSAVLVDNEIMKVVSVNLLASTVNVQRACADTIPARHGIGAVAWFYDSTLRSTNVPYVLNDVVDVKLLTRSELTEVGEDMVPIDTVTMLGRLNRPYPPANLMVNGQNTPSSLSGTVEVTWAGRNKTSQGSSLIPWNSANVAPPNGTTFIVRAYDADSATLIHESTPISYLDHSYNLYVEFTGNLNVTVTSYLGGLPCWQVPDLAFEYTSEVTVVLVTEGDEPIETEDEVPIFLEDESALMFGSSNGELPDDWGGIEEEEEEEDGMGTGTTEGGGVVIGVKISELPQMAGEFTGEELVPIVKGNENYWASPEQLYEHISGLLPPPVDGKSAYQIAVANGYIGSEAQWLSSLRGDPGPSSNASRRILTVTSASGAVVCNWLLYDEIRLRLTGPITLNFTGARDGQGCLLKIQQDAVGGRLVTLPANVRFNTLVQFYAPSPNPGIVDKIGFIYDGADSSYDLSALIQGITI